MGKGDQKRKSSFGATPLKVLIGDFLGAVWNKQVQELLSPLKYGPSDHAELVFFVNFFYFLLPLFLVLVLASAHPPLPPPSVILLHVRYFYLIAGVALVIILYKCCLLCIREMRIPTSPTHQQTLYLPYTHQPTHEHIAPPPPPPRICVYT